MSINISKESGNKKKKVFLVLFMLLVASIGIGAFFVNNDQKDNGIGIGKWIYNIHYELDGGTLPDNAPNFYDNRKDTPLVNPTKDYYRFIGWKDNESGRIVESIPKGSQNDKTYIAMWAENQITIRYHSNGGTRYTSDDKPLETNEIIKEYSRNFNQVSPPEGLESFFTNRSGLYMKREGYHPTPNFELDEWILNTPDSGIYFPGHGTFKYQELAEKAGKGEELKKGNVTVDLYANWVPNINSLTFDYQGGTCNDMEMVRQVATDSSIGMLPVPKKENMIFVGWYDAIDGGKQYLGTSKMTPHDLTLYARFVGEEDFTPFTITADNYWQAGIKREGEVIIPEFFEYNGNWYKVTEIGDIAFNGCNKLTKVEIPDTVEKIGYAAFQYSGVTGVEIPGNVKNIGNYAFYATNIDNLVLNEGVLTIGTSAFVNTNLKSVVIPSSISQIEQAAFYGLEKIMVSENNKIYDSRENCNAIIKTKTNELVLGSYNVVIPESVETIIENAFSGVSKDYLFIPASVKDIRPGAFYDASFNNVEVSLDNKTYDTRDNCNAIINTKENELVVGFKNSIIPTSINSIGQRAFSGVKGIKNIIIPGNIKIIKKDAFSYCAMENFVLEDGIEKIEYMAFYGNYPPAIHIPSSVYSIASGAFGNNGDVSLIRVDANNNTYDSRENCNAIIETATNTLVVGFKNSIIPDSVKIIGDFAFHNTGITDIEIPDGVVEIGDNAFRLSSFTHVSIPKSVKILGNNVFANCRSLKNIKLDEGLVSIGSLIFQKTQLESITLPNSLTTMETRVFENIDTLTEVKFGNGLKTIPSYSFASCNNLKNINIPEGIEVIEDNAFSNTRLESLLLPSTLKTIGNKAFMDITSLTSDIVIPNNVTSIGAEAFRGCLNVPHIILGNGLTTIGGGAFFGCTGVESIAIPNTVTRINANAFYQVPLIYYSGSASGAPWGAYNIQTNPQIVSRFLKKRCSLLEEDNVQENKNTIETKKEPNEKQEINNNQIIIDEIKEDMILEDELEMRKSEEESIKEVNENNDELSDDKKEENINENS